MKFAIRLQAAGDRLDSERLRHMSGQVHGSDHADELRRSATTLLKEGIWSTVVVIDVPDSWGTEESSERPATIEEVR